MMLASFAAAGGVIGLMLENATGGWVFLLTYLPIPISDPGVKGPIAYSTFAAVVVCLVSHAKECRRAILLPLRRR